ncbi:MAG: 4Fe-4S binding protein [Nitrospirae bacterium]|nr:4Fe-4S binding protein [Nitrospirota bacterium]
MPIRKGKRQKAQGTGQKAKEEKGSRVKGQKKKKGQGSRVEGQGKSKIKKTKKPVRPAKRIKPSRKTKPAKKAAKARPSKKAARALKKKTIKATPSVPETRADMVSAMAHEFKRDIMVVPGKCNACAGMDGPQCVEACRKAIAYQHKEVKPIPRITIKKSQGFNIPILCHNCEEAPCMSACMTGTRRRLPETGWVETDYNRCVGCWMCVMVCPFGAIIRSEEEHLARKCDGCTSYKTAPCVAACKPGAIVQTGAYSYDYEKRKEYAERLGYQQRLVGTTKKPF